MVLYNILGVNLTSFGNIAEYPPPTLVNLLLRIPHSIRVRPGPQKPWKSLNFSFQNLRPRKSLNFTKNSRGPWKVLKFSLLSWFHFVWFRVAIAYWKINNEAWSILFLFIPAGCLNLWCVWLQGLGSAAKTLPKFPSDNPVSLLGHIEADGVNVSSFTHINRANGFHSQEKRLSFDQIMLLKLRENHMIWTIHLGSVVFKIVWCKTRYTVAVLRAVCGRAKKIISNISELAALPAIQRAKSIPTSCKHILIQYLDSGCSNTFTSYHFVNFFSTFELTMDSVVEVNTSPYLLKHINNEFVSTNPIA